MFSMDLLLGAVVFGVLLGCFYAAVSVGLSVSFGLLDVPQVAHPAFLVLASARAHEPWAACGRRSARTDRAAAGVLSRLRRRRASRAQRTIWVDTASG